jgi:hypothetical protein
MVHDCRRSRLDDDSKGRHARAGEMQRANKKKATAVLLHGRAIAVGAKSHG